MQKKPEVSTEMDADQPWDRVEDEWSQDGNKGSTLICLSFPGWCTGRTQRDGMGREEGGGFWMGNTCIPVADSF